MAKKYERLTLDERVKIELGLSHNMSYSAIAADLSRCKSSISREVSPWTRERYSALKAQNYADKGASIRKKGHKKILGNAALSGYIHQKLEVRWSPEQISRSLQHDYLNDAKMQVSHETIYRYVYVHCKKTLRQELISQLRRKKKNRGKPRKTEERTRGKIAGAISIDE